MRVNLAMNSSKYNNIYDDITFLKNSTLIPIPELAIQQTVLFSIAKLILYNRNFHYFTTSTLTTLFVFVCSPTRELIIYGNNHCLC